MMLQLSDRKMCGIINLKQQNEGTLRQHYIDFVEHFIKVQPDSFRKECVKLRHRIPSTSTSASNNNEFCDKYSICN